MPANSPATRDDRKGAEARRTREEDRSRLRPTVRRETLTLGCFASPFAPSRLCGEKELVQAFDRIPVGLIERTAQHAEDVHVERQSCATPRQQLTGFGGCACA